jgi:hypothetical protein
MDNRSVRKWWPSGLRFGLLALAAIGLFAGTATAAPPRGVAPSRITTGAVNWRGATWRADAVQGGEGAPIGVTVYRSSAGSWHLQGQVRLVTGGVEPEAGDLGAAGESIYAAGLTGAAAPDFVMVTQGLTTTPWFSVISDVGGFWHLVPVDFGYRPLTGVPAKVKVEGRLVRVEVGGQVYSPSTTGWYGFSGGAFSPTNPPGPRPPCDARDLGGVPASNGEGQVPPSHYACQDGWALLTGTFEMSPFIQLLNWQGSSGWQVIDSGAQLDDAPMWYGLPLTTLEGLGASVGGFVVPLAAAAAVISRYPQAAVEGYGAELPDVADSGVVYQYSQDWLAVAKTSPAGPGASLDVGIYRWRGHSWTEQGVVGVRGFYGDLDSSPGGPAVLPEALTGGLAPDFTISASGADTHWFAVVSDIGGKWRGVPFDYGTKPTTAIDEAAVSGDLVEAELDFCGCAIGPESELWYQYAPARGEFLPTTPPGPPASCTGAVMHQAVVVDDVTVDRVACADGWAVAAGTRGTSGVLVLLEQQGSGWQAVNLVAAPVIDVHALSAVADEYLVPASVLAELAAGLHTHR